METKTALAGETGDGSILDPDEGPRLSDALVTAARAGFDGDLLRPGDDGYETARRVWNGMVDRRPALIARCIGAGDVIAAIRLARDQGMEIAFGAAVTASSDTA